MSPFYMDFVGFRWTPTNRYLCYFFNKNGNFISKDVQYHSSPNNQNSGTNLAQIWHASGTIPPMEVAQNPKTISPTSGTKINNHPPGAFLTLHKVTPVGALQVRKRESGAVTFYWRYSIGNKSERVSIGQYDSVAPPKSLSPTRKGYSVAGATRAAELLAADHHSNRGIGGRPALKAAELASQVEIARQRHHAVAHTLENLLNHYSDHLEKLGRSHKETRSIFKCHVFDPWPEYKALIANEVNDEQMTNMIRKVAESGKGRTANKLRSYLRAAYETAKTSRTKGSVPAHFKDYEVRTNPAADTSPDESQNRSDKDPLTIEELRIYWRNIKKLPGLPGAVLRVHLLSGAQRIEQLVRLLSKDVSRDAFRIFDGKGRPGSAPRSHLV